MRRLALLVLILFAGKTFATGEINVLTDLNSPFPPGCVGVSLPTSPVSDENELHDEVVPAPSVDSQALDSNVRITIWRVGCHDPGMSVIMVRLQHISGGDVLVPQVYAEAGDVNIPAFQAQLIGHPAVGNVGATGNFITDQGTTYMLAVDGLAIGPDEYNDLLSVEFFWGDFSPDAAPVGEWFPLAEYSPALDPTQFEFPLLHGRMSGQYTIDGIPRSGLVLQVAEEVDDTNFVFAVFFTYLNGEPFWVTGNTGTEAPGFDIVQLNMVRLEGGEFFTVPPGSFSDDDVQVESIGTMWIEALDCNTLLLGYDFTQAGLGSGELHAHRLIRIAGYDCNPWQ